MKQAFALWQQSRLDGLVCGKTTVIIRSTLRKNEFIHFGGIIDWPYELE